MDRRRRTLLLAVPAMFGLVAAGACGDGGDRGRTAAPPTTTRTSTTSMSTTSTATPADGAGFATVAVEGKSAEQGLLASVTATSAGGVDAVTFTFEGALPGYRVGYADRPIVQDGSGEEVQVAGDSVLQARFEHASGYDFNGGGRQVYRGPERLAISTPVVKDVVRNGDFEGVLRWAIGVSGKPQFRVRTAASPNRIIVEVRRAP